MRSKNRVIASLALVSIMASLTGCGTTIFTEDATKYPLVAPLTESEVVDYYAKALDFDSIVTKNLDIDRTIYEMKDVDAETSEVLKNKVLETQKILANNKYEYSEEIADLIDEETYHYIKSYLNDRQLLDASFTSFKQALGYYFIDVQYSIKAGNCGVLKPASSLLGINGAFYHSDYYNEDKIDSTFLEQGVKLINEYYAANRINKVAEFNTLTNSIVVKIPGEESSSIDFTESTVTDSQVTNETVSDDEIENQNRVVNNTTSTKASYLDINEFNRVVGSSLQYSSYMPSLDVVYSVPASSENISGVGIYKAGDYGLKQFGYDRNQMLGTVTLRYVYKEDLNNESTLINTNIYPVFSEITTGFASNNDNIVPEFLMLEFEKLVERADRVSVNMDMTALVSGDIFAYPEIGILRGYESNYVNVLRQMSTVRRVVARDIESSTYLLEVETQRQEGPKGADVYGTYRDKSYVVVQQDGQKFVITDWVTMTRELQTEPDINPDSAIAKRLVALNLAGEVTDEAKQSATQLLNQLYTASTNRVLNASEEEPKEVQTSNGVVAITRGMYDCFNSDTTILSSSDKEDINSRIRSLLIKNGIGVPAQMNGIVTEWIGGADNQVEFTTEEVITYTGRDDGIYLQCYYLISNMGDEWVIDDIQIIEQQELSGSEFQSHVSRILG